MFGSFEVRFEDGFEHCLPHCGGGNLLCPTVQGLGQSLVLVLVLADLLDSLLNVTHKLFPHLHVIGQCDGHVGSLGSVKG